MQYTMRSLPRKGASQAPFHDRHRWRREPRPTLDPDVSRTKSREFRSQLGVHASSWKTRASFSHLPKR